jgi:hypothetical protein
MNILIRDITLPREPKVLAELQVNSNDIVPSVGDKISHHVKKKGFLDSELHVVRTFDVITRNFYIADIGTRSERISSINYEVKNDGTEVDN